MSVGEQIMGRFVTSLKTTGNRCLISLPCSPGSLRNDLFHELIFRQTLHTIFKVEYLYEKNMSRTESKIA